MVGQGGGHDLGGTGGAPVDQDHHRQASGEVAALYAPDMVGLRIAPMRDHSDTVIEHQRHGGHRLLQQAATVAAQIEDQPMHRVPTRLHDLVEELAHLDRGVGGEAGHPQHHDVAAGEREHRLRRHRGAHQADLLRRAVSPRCAKWSQGQGDRAAFGTVEQARDAGLVEGADRLAVDGEQPLSDRDAGGPGRTVGVHRADQGVAAGPADRDAGTRGGSVAGGALAGGGQRRDIARIRVEMVEQLVEEALQHRLLAGFAQRRGVDPGRLGHGGRRLRPGGGIGVSRRLLRIQQALRRHQAHGLAGRLGGQGRVDRGQPVQAPQGELTRGRGLQRARPQELQCCADDAAHHGRIEAGHRNLGVGRARRPQQHQNGRPDADAPDHVPHHGLRAVFSRRAAEVPRGGAAGVSMANSRPPVRGAASVSRTTNAWVRR